MGIEATTKGIHGYAESPMPAVTAHDIYHSKLHNTLPPEFHMMLNHMNQIIGKYTRQKWSKAMWELVDREFQAFQYQDINLDSPKSGAKFFMELLHFMTKDHTILFKNADQRQLNDDGFAIVWNMVNESDTWKKLYKIDIDKLDYYYPELIKEIRSFKQAIGSKQKEPSELLTLKYRYFQVTSKTEFQRICGLLDSLEKKLIIDKDQHVTDKDQKLVFGKYAKGSDKNITILKFGKQKLDHESSLKKLIPTLVNMQLISIFGEKNEDAVSSELQKITGEFKSTHQNSQLTKELLENSITKLPSITAKLDFLEACYEKIIHSKGYTRRHTIIDNVFSFFKNPLTTSQRQHIVLLKQILNQIVSEYQREKKLNDEQINELQWYMKNRNSNLSICNTDRFYLHIDSTVPSRGI